MPDQEPNPLTKHLLQMVQGRQQAEVAKIALLTELTGKLSEAVSEIKAVHAAVDELIERTKLAK